MNTLKLCHQCPNRLGVSRRTLLIDLSQRIAEHRSLPGLLTDERADDAIIEEAAATSWLCLFCVEAGANDAA